MVSPSFLSCVPGAGGEDNLSPQTLFVGFRWFGWLFKPHHKQPGFFPVFAAREFYPLRALVEPLHHWLRVVVCSLTLLRLTPVQTQRVYFGALSGDQQLPHSHVSRGWLGDLLSARVCVSSPCFVSQSRSVTGSGGSSLSLPLCSEVAVVRLESVSPRTTTPCAPV